MVDKTKMSRNMLFFVTMVFWFGLYAYTPFVNPQLITMGVTASVMGFVAGAYGFTQLILRIPVGVFSDKWQKKFFICVGCLSTGLSALCMLLFHNPTGFLIGRALGGVAASSWVPFTVLYASYYSSEDSTRSITIINMANQLGRLFSFLMAAWAASWFGPQAAFFLSAVGGFLGFAMSLSIKEEKASAEKKPVSFRELIAVGGDRNVLIISLLGILTQIVAFATYTAFTANHAVYIEASLAQLGYVQMAFLLPGILLSLFLSKFILQRVDAKYLVVLGFALKGVYCVFVPLTQTVAQLYLVQIIGGISGPLTLALLMGLCVQKVAIEKRGAAMGFFQSIYSVGMVIGPLMMGFLTDFAGLRFGFFVMAGVSAMATLASGIFLQKSKTT